MKDIGIEVIERPVNYRPRRKKKRAYVIECRWKSDTWAYDLFSDAGKWKKYRGYASERDRQQALASLTQDSSSMEFRIPPGE